LASKAKPAWRLEADMDAAPTSMKRQRRAVDRRQEQGRSTPKRTRSNMGSERGHVTFFFGERFET